MTKQSSNLGGTLTPAMSSINLAAAAISSCERGDLSELQRVLEETEFDIGSEPLDDKGQTALHIACANGHLHIAQYLVNEKRCSVNVIAQRKTCLSIARSNGYLHIVKYLLRSKARRDPDMTELHVACVLGDTEEVKVILNKTPALLSTMDCFGLTPTHYASCEPSTLDVILDWQRKLGIASVVFSQDNRKNSPLHYAALVGCLEAALKLLESANQKYHYVNSVNSDGDTPLHLATNKISTSVVEMLARHPQCDVNIQNKRGDTALHLSIKSKRRSIMYWILDSTKCDANIRNNGGDTALHIAVQHKSELFFALVQHRKCNVNIQNRHGDTALHLAIKNERNKMLESILEKGINYDPNIQNSDGNTPLHIAIIEQRSAYLVSVLTEHKNCYPSITNKAGNTPMQIALDTRSCYDYAKAMIFSHRGCSCEDLMNLSYKHPDMCISILFTTSFNTRFFKEFINAGWGNIQDANGDSVLHVACEEGSVEMVHFLVKNNCNVNIRNRNRHTPMDIAVIKRNPALVEELREHKHCDPNEADRAMSNIMHFEDVKRLQKCTPRDLTKLSDEDPVMCVYILCRAMFSTQFFQNFSSINLFQNLLWKGWGNLKNIWGDTVLHSTCERGSNQMVRFLVHNNCDVNIPNRNRDTALHIAIRSTQHNAEKVQCILMSGKCDPNITNDAKNTPLHVAVQKNDFGIFCEILRNKCDINIQNKEGNTPLHLAVIGGCQDDIVKALSEHQSCDPNLLNSKSMTPLHIAAAVGRVEHVKVVIMFCDPSIRNGRGNTPLHEAVIQRYPRNILTILAQHESCNKLNMTGYTPLHLACKGENIESVKVLVESPTCNLNVQNSDEDTALHIAIRSTQHNAEKVQCILMSGKCNPNITNDAKNTPLHVAVQKNDFRILGKILRNKCDINIQNTEGNTPLHLAVIGGCQDDIVKALSEHQSCDPNLLNSKSMTPLHIAAAVGRVEHVKVVIMFCDPSIRNGRGNTPLHEAVIQRYPRNILTILAQHESCNKLNMTGYTPLHLACKGENIESVKILVESPTCNLNVQNRNRDTALHIAIRSTQHNAEKVQCILMSGKCNPNITNDVKNTPLHVAVQKNDFGIFCEILRNKQCNVNVKNTEGNTPLHLAVIGGCQDDIVKAFSKHKSCDPNLLNSRSMTPLHIAAAVGKIEHVDILITSSDRSIFSSGCIRLNKKDVIETVNSTLLLHKVVISGRSELFSTLLHYHECDVDVYQRNPEGETVLHLACRKRNIKFVEILGKIPRCDVNIQNSDGDTALHVAILSKHDNAEKVKFLLRNSECDPNIRNNAKYTPLHVAVETKKFNIVDALVECQRCDPRVPNLRGNTPLHEAVIQMSSTAILKTLAGHKGCNEINENGYTPLHLACKERSIESVKALVESPNCNLNVKNSDGDTALHIAIQSTQHNAERVQIGVVPEPKNAETESLGCKTSEIKPETVQTEVVECQAVKTKTVQRNTAKTETVEAILNILVKCPRCDPGILNRKGNTPLYDAVMRMAPIGILRALAQDESCNTISSSGYTPLQQTCLEGREEEVRVLLQGKADVNKQNKNGDTALHIVCRIGCNNSSAKTNVLRLVQVLLSTPGIDPNIVNYAGSTAIEEAGSKYDVLKLISAFHKHSKLETYLNIFVIGNSGSGKSRMIKTVITEAPEWLRYFLFLWKIYILFKPEDDHCDTAGIIPTAFKSKHFGHAVLYELAGQYEYHDKVIENLMKKSSPPLFLLMIDISKPMEEIEKELKYWWKFIDNHSKKATETHRPHAILVGSHADIVGDYSQKLKLVADSIRSMDVSFMYVQSFPLDCTKVASQEFKSLLSTLDETCNTLREKADTDFHCGILNAFLNTKNFQEQVYWKICHIQEKIESDDVLLPQDSLHLIQLLKALSDQGRIVLLINESDVKESWVILKEEVLFKRVNSSIFASQQYFKKIVNNTGVVTLSKIKETFPDINHKIITGYLTRINYCFLIEKQFMGMLSQTDPSLLHAIESAEEYYFFPHLVQRENPTDVFKPHEMFTYKCGWLYKCHKENKQLTTHFLHVLIFRLAFSCQPPDDPTERESVVLLRSCSVWKHGIAWGTNDGIETVVEVNLQSGWVAVMMRCPDTHKVQCAKLRSTVISTVLRTKKIFCPDTEMKEFLISSSSIHYPFKERELTLYSMREVAQVIKEGTDFAKDIEGKNLHRVSELLAFEPYYKLGELIGNFFTKEQSLNTEIPSEYMEQIAKKSHKSLSDFETALQPDLIAYEEECSRVGGSEVKKCVALFRTLKNSQKRAMKTWRDFEREFSRFSIFCGRNPMVSVYSNNYALT